jgi:hypothetical protein
VLINGVDLTVQLADLQSRSFLGDPIDPGLDLNSDAQSLPAVLAPDGRRMAYNVPGGVVMWDLHPSALRAAACRVAGRDLTSIEWARYLGPLGSRRPLCSK